MATSFWVAAARGCDFKVLKNLGFTVFYPALDDYAFLEVSDENKYLFKQQESLRIKFLREGSGKGYLQVKDTDLDKMFQVTKDNLVPGSRIIVVEGYCVGLEGSIHSRDGESLECVVKGYRREFEVTLTTNQVALAPTDKES